MGNALFKTDREIISSGLGYGRDPRGKPTTLAAWVS